MSDYYDSPEGRRAIAEYLAAANHGKVKHVPGPRKHRWAGFTLLMWGVGIASLVAYLLGIL